MLVAGGLIGPALTGATAQAAATRCSDGITLLGVTLILDASGNVNLFVSASQLNPATADGSKDNPYRTITRAVQRAREIRQQCTNPIKIHVLPGTYTGAPVGDDLTLETLPIRIDIPNVALLGSTVLATDPGGLPNGSTSNASTLTIAAPSPTVGALIYVTPSTAVPGVPANDVTIAGFVLDATASPTTSDIAIDRAQRFTIHSDVFIGEGFGTTTRASSGSIDANYGNDLTGSAGVAVAGGTTGFPATVNITGNRLAHNNHGYGALCAGTADGNFPFPPGSDPQSTVRDLFDTVACNVTGNDLSDNGIGGGGPTTNPGGIRLMTLTLAPLSSAGNVTATISNNTFNHDAIAITIDAGFPYRESPQQYTGTLFATLRNNVITNSTIAPALVTFTRVDAAQDPSGLVASPTTGDSDKYLVNSTFTLSDTGELTGAWLDSPAQDPVSCTTLSNHLLINGVERSPTRTGFATPQFTPNPACPHPYGP